MDSCDHDDVDLIGLVYPSDGLPRGQQRAGLALSVHEDTGQRPDASDSGWGPPARRGTPGDGIHLLHPGEHLLEMEFIVYIQDNIS